MAQRLAQHLIARGLLHASKVDDALKRQGRGGGALDTALLEAGAVSEAGILQAISDVSGLRLVNLADFEPNVEAGPMLPLKMARQLSVVPLSLDGNALHLACAYPVSQTQLKDVGFLLGRTLELWVALECRVRDWQSILYGQPLEPRFAKLLYQLDPSRKPPPPSAPERPNVSLAPEVQARVSRGLVDEPLLLDKVKKPRKKKAELEILDAPALGDELEDPRTTVIDPTAYSRFARGGESDSTSGTPLDDVDSTRVVDVRGYENFAREVGTLGRATTETDAQAIEPKFPGGVLPPRTSQPVPAPSVKPVAPEPTWLRPEQPGRPARSSPQRPAAARPLPPQASPGRPAVARPSIPKLTAPSADETDFSDVQVETTNPRASAPPRSSAPPPQPTPQVKVSPQVLASARPGAPKRHSDTDRFAAASGPEAGEGRFDVADRGARPANQPLGDAQPAEAPGRFDVAVPAQAAEMSDDASASQDAGAYQNEGGYQDAGAYPNEAGHQDAAAYQNEGGYQDAGAYQDAAAYQNEPGYQDAGAYQNEGGYQDAAAYDTAAYPAEGTYSAQTQMAVAVQAGGVSPMPPGLAPSNAAEWTLAQARESLPAAAQSREALVSVILEYGRRTFDFVAAFAVMRGAAVGWDARGEDDASALVRQVAIPLDAASVFRTVAVTRGSYVGPLPPDALSQHYLTLLGRAPRTVFLWPVEVQSKLVAIFYGDCGTRPVSQRRLSDFILFCRDLPPSFHELILLRRQNPRAEQQFTSGEALPNPQAGETLEDSALADAEWFNGLITLLTGPDPAERSMAMAELMRTPDASGLALAAVFPGPSGWSRLPVTELPEPDELGPIAGALARLGAAGARALGPLLDADESDTRYMALLAAGSMRYGEVVPGVVRGLFDFEPDVSSAARAAAASLKFLPELQTRLPELRAALLSEDPLYRGLAARALGGLHDRESVQALITLTGSPDEMAAQAAADSLREITRASYGADPRAWASWWVAAVERRRIEWLVDALMSTDFDARLSAIEELSRGLGDNLGYFADGDEASRSQAVVAWQALVQSRPELDL